MRTSVAAMPFFAGDDRTCERVPLPLWIFYGFMGVVSCTGWDACPHGRENRVELYQTSTG